MLRKIVFIILAAALGLVSFSGCRASDPLSFITMRRTDDTSKVLRLGMNGNDVSLCLGGGYTSQADSGLHLSYADNTMQNLVNIESLGGIYVPDSGVTNKSTVSDILAAYQKDPDVKVLQNDAQKLILGKQIDGVNYTLTFRFYASDGSIKAITATNTDLHEDVDSDYPSN